MGDRDIDQAITALKKGAYLLKYGRRGKPKFCPFQLSNDESALIWYSGKEEKQIKVDRVSRIIPGQRTAIFRRYPRPDKEYQSFSLIYGDRSLDLICKDKDEAEVWFVGIKALINRSNYIQKWRTGTISGTSTSENSHAQTSCSTITPVPDPDLGDACRIPTPASISQRRLGKAFSDIILQTDAPRASKEAELSSINTLNSLTSSSVDNTNLRTSTSDNVRNSLSSVASLSSQNSFPDDNDSLGDVFIWGENTGNGFLGDGCHRIGNGSSFSNFDTHLPKVLTSTTVIDVHKIACGGSHAVLVNRQGEIFSWGEGSGGKLGHGSDTGVAHPKLVEALAGKTIELIACGEYHTCAITSNGDLYTWGDGANNSGILGHQSEASHWIPKQVGGIIASVQISYVSCGPWHTAIVSSTGQLFTFGDGSFGVLGHGDCSSTNIPKVVEALRGLRTLKVACGVWHTAAVVELANEPSSSGDPCGGPSSAKLFTWGQGDNVRLGHGDAETRLFPVMVGDLSDKSICQVACGINLTVALTAGGQVYTMGSTAYGQLGSPKANGEVPHLVGGKLGNIFAEEIACGSYHIAVLTSKGELHTWGKGTNGQLGHGDYKNRNTPTIVSVLKDKQVKTVACGANFTAVVCVHKSVSVACNSACSGCRNPFNFRRKRHNCYHCGLVFCNACSVRRSLGAALAPNTIKPYRVCDECHEKLQKEAEPFPAGRSCAPKFGASLKPNEVTNKVKLQSQLSSLSSVDSVGRCSGTQRNNLGNARDRGTRVIPVLDGDLQRAARNIIRTLKQPNERVDASRFSLDHLTASRLCSSAVSAENSGRSSAPQVSSANSCRLIGTLEEEITHLRAKIEELTSKSERLEADLWRKSQDRDGGRGKEEKCKSNKEIKSANSQQRDMAARQIERCSSDQNFRVVDRSSSDFRHPSGSAVASHGESDSNVVDNQASPQGATFQTEAPQQLIQAQLGVFLTLSPLPDGFNELKRVRFSRKHFTEREAEKWWAENESMLLDQHNIRTSR